MCQRCSACPTRQNEFLEGRQIGVELVKVVFQLIDVLFVVKQAWERIMIRTLRAVRGPVGAAAGRLAA